MAVSRIVRWAICEDTSGRRRYSWRIFLKRRSSRVKH